MNWTDILTHELKYAYHAADGLMDLVEDEDLDWKPLSGDNWMTNGQLLYHVAEACGMAIKGFVTGDFGLPEGVSVDDMGSGDMLPPAEAMPTVASVAEAKEKLAADRDLAFEMLRLAGEERMQNEPSPAPWDPTSPVLGHRMMEMVQHLAQHKGQLFYYLKLQGKQVNTMHLWGAQLAEDREAERQA